MNQFSYIIYTASKQFSLIAKTRPEDTVVLFASNALAFYNLETAFSRGIKHVIYLNDLCSTKYYLKEPIEVTIYGLGNEVLAEFQEAEISVSEDTGSEALSWLKARIVGSYVRFKNQRDKLGPVPVRQLQVLEKYIGEE